MSAAQLALVLFAVVAVAGIAIVYFMVFAPPAPAKQRHQLYVKLINASDVTKTVLVDSVSQTLEPGESRDFTVRSDANIGPLVLGPNVHTVYILDTAVSSNLDTVEVRYVNRSGVTTMLVDASGTGNRIAKEIVAPWRSSVYAYPVARGSVWQIVNPARKDLILARLTVGRPKGDETSLSFDGFSLQLATAIERS